MKLLALDTSSTACSIALQIDQKIFSQHVIMPMQQAQSILPMIKNLLDETNLKLNELDAIAFGKGPGSFTGIRIAASVAQGLSFGAKLPVIAISSLQALAQAAYDSLDWKRLLVAVDARMQEVYWGTYVINSKGLAELIGEEMINSPNNIPFFEDQSWSGVGNGWEVYRERISHLPQKMDATILPTATAILALAGEKWLNKEDLLKPEEALPTYLRLEVAKKSRDGEPKQ